MRCPALAPPAAALLLVTESACQTPTGTAENFDLTPSLLGDEPADVTPVSADTEVQKDVPNHILPTALRPAAKPGSASWTR